MVCWKEHRRLCTKLLGAPYKWVHEWMDHPYPILVGKHRLLYHDLNTLCEGVVLQGDENTFWAGIIHIWQDATDKHGSPRTFYNLIQHSYGDEEGIFGPLAEEIASAEQEEDLKKIVQDQTKRELVRQYVEKEREEAGNLLQAAGIEFKPEPSTLDVWVTNERVQQIGIHISPTDSGKKYREKLRTVIFPLKDSCSLCGASFMYNVGTLNKLFSLLQSLDAVSIVFHLGLLREKGITQVRTKKWEDIHGNVSIFGLCLHCTKTYVGKQLFRLMADLAQKYRALKDLLIEREYGWASQPNHMTSHKDPSHRWPYVRITGPPLYQVLKITGKLGLDVSMHAQAGFSKKEIEIMKARADEIDSKSISPDKFLKDYYMNNELVPQRIKYYWI